MPIPPGPVYLAQTIPKYLASPAVLYVVYYAAKKYGNVDLFIPTWLKIISLALSVPLTLIVRRCLSEFLQAREARALGAVRLPSIPTKWPAGIDLLRQIIKLNVEGYQGDFARVYTKEYGHTFNMNIFYEDRIFTSEPEIIKAILATDFPAWEKGPVFKRMFQSLLGDGVFNADGDLWKFHRSIARPFFSRDRISHFELFGRHADQALDAMSKRLHEGYAVDFQDLVGRFTLDSATDFLFGHCVNVLDSGLPYSPNEKNAPVPSKAFRETDRATKFADAFAEAQEVVAIRNRFNSAWPLAEFWKDKSLEPLKTIEAFIDPILRDAVERKRAAASSGDKKDEADEDDTFLSSLVRSTDDIKILRDEILNIMIAGRDTTAATLTYAVYCLALYPEIMQKLRTEIIDRLGTDRTPTPEDFRDMKYLRAFINEVLRLYPPVPFNTRSSVHSTTVPNMSEPGAKPWYIPGGTKVIYGVFLMHRRKDLWGPDAEKFDPDRFLDYRLHKYLTPRPFIFLPFNAGPRICLGQQFAYNETSFFLVRLLQKYNEITLDLDAQPENARPPAHWRTTGEPDDRKRFELIWPKGHLTIYAFGGLWVRMTEAPANEAA